MDSAQINTGGRMPAAASAKQKGISGSTIKLIAVAAMLIDHIAATILMRQIMERGFMDVAASDNLSNIMEWLTENGVLFYGNQLMRMIGRLGFPIFCFLLVEGFQRTRNVKRYALRLAAFALLSEIPFDLATKGELFYMGYQNVYFTLLLGLLALWGINWLGQHELPGAVRVISNVTGILMPGVYLMALTCNMFKGDLKSLFVTGVAGALAAAVALLIYRAVRGEQRAQLFCAELTVLTFCMCAAEALMTDYAGMGVLTIGVMYFFRRKKVLSMLAGCIVLTIMSFSEITAFFALIPIALYNGSRGVKMKYFFYAFYPVHLALLYIICVWMGLGQVAMP